MGKGYPDYEGEKSKLFTVADWAAIEATDKNFYGTASDQIRDAGAIVSYTVPAGKTLYITHFTFSIRATDAEAAELNQICHAVIYDETSGDHFIHQGGNGGGSTVINKPIVIPAEHKVNFLNYNRSNHNCEVSLHAGGYEL